MTTNTSSSTTVAVLEAIADAENTDALDLPPLYDAVDTDALEAIFEPTPDGCARTGHIEFDYHGYSVSVECEPDGTVVVEAVHRSTERQSDRTVAEISLD